MFETIFKNRFSVVLSAIGSLKKSAELTGVSYEQVSRWRDLKSRPPLFAIATLCQEAGVSVDWVLGLEDTQQLDSQLLTNCIKAAEEHLDERGEKLDPENKAKLISNLYAIRLKEKLENSEIISQSISSIG